MQQSGLERFMTMYDGRSTKIAHIFLLSGNTNDLVDKLPRAFMNVINKNPRMRSKSITGSFKIITSPKVDLSQAQKLVAVVNEDWKEFVQSEAEIPFDRFNELPYKISVVAESESKSRLIVWSDHYMADGYSGLIVFNDLLTNIRDECIELPELPLKKSIFEFVVKKNWFAYQINKFLCKIMEKPVLAEMKEFRTTLNISSKMPVDPDAEQCPTFAFFADGESENLKKSIARCRAEKTTLNAAILVLVAVAFAKTVGVNDKLKLALDIDYNMRNKVKGLDEKDIGFNITIGTIESLKKGLDFSGKFWDAAKELKKESLTANTSFLAKMVQTFVHLKFNRFSSFEIPHHQTCINDVNLSNIGRYPFEKQVGGYNLESFHVYNTTPYVGPSVILYLCSTDHIGFSMASKVEDTQAKKVFDLFVSLVEKIHEISSDLTIRQVLDQIN
ncbi:hypothetical protein HDV01_007696 [Terramyces sp. JEL0728]|nr:hypothetical protein HDV01_007696 [Terramyces sp. JEL0728]